MQKHYSIPPIILSLLLFISIGIADTVQVRKIIRNDKILEPNKNTHTDGNQGNLDTIIITEHPKNDTVVAGDTAMFWVKATGTSLNYQWQRNDGGWHDITPGGNDDTLSFISESTDSRVSFRCVINSSQTYDTSDFGILYIAIKPTITSSFRSDTVLPVGDNLTLTISVNAFPPPSYEWFFIYKGAAPVLKSTSTTLSLTCIMKSDSGVYYCKISNYLGSASSDSIFVHTLKRISITTNLPTTYNVIHGGAASIDIRAAGDGVISYQWYESDTALPGQTNNNLGINPVDSAIHNGNTYNCQAKNTYLGMTVGTETSITCTLKISNFYNPFKVKADYDSLTKVIIKLWSDVDITNFPTTEPFPGIPWADSVWVIYKSINYPETIQEPNVAFALYSTEEIKQAGDTVVKTLPVALLLPGGAYPFPHDSCYYFCNTVKWHNPDTLLSDFIPGNSLFMVDSVSTEVKESISSNKITMNQYVIQYDHGNISIRYTIPFSAFVKLEAFDINGRLVEVIQDKFMHKGSYSVNWDSKRFGAGVYYIKLSTEYKNVSRKFVLLK